MAAPEPNAAQHAADAGQGGRTRRRDEQRRNDGTDGPDRPARRLGPHGGGANRDRPRQPSTDDLPDDRAAGRTTRNRGPQGRKTERKTRRRAEMADAVHRERDRPGDAAQRRRLQPPDRGTARTDKPRRIRGAPEQRRSHPARRGAGRKPDDRNRNPRHGRTALRSADQRRNAGEGTNSKEPHRTDVGGPRGSRPRRRANGADPRSDVLRTTGASRTTQPRRGPPGAGRGPRSQGASRCPVARPAHGGAVHRPGTA